MTKEKKVKDYIQFQAHKMNTYKTVDFEKLIDNPSGESLETVTLRSENRAEVTDLGVISIQVVSDAVGNNENDQEERGELEKQWA